MNKRVMEIAVAVMLLFSIFVLTACSGDKANKIDIGGTPKKSLIASVQARVLMNNDIFSHDDDIKITVGWGFSSGHNVSFFIEIGSVIVVKIEEPSITVIDESDLEYNGEYEKEFKEYSDEKFICTLKKKRYIPNYYETFQIKLNSNSPSGTIQISVTNLWEGTQSGSGEGQTLRLYYASNSDKIAFSSVSVVEAQKKLT